MEIINIVKSTALSGSNKAIYGQPQTGKTKYFLDHIHASFHIQTCARAFEFKIEPHIAFFDGNKFFDVKKANETPSEEIRQLTPGKTYQVYVNIVSNGDDRNEYDSGTYTHYITTKKPYSSSTTDTIFIDENHSIYWVGEELPMQKIAPELAALSPSIDQALRTASNRQTAEYQHAASLFAQREQEFLRAKQEFERKKAELDLEAAALSSDAMDFSQ